MRISFLWCGVLLAAGLSGGYRPAFAQGRPECGVRGYRVIASRWDSVLRGNWELRQDCAHPEWPARLVVAAMGPLMQRGVVSPARAAQIVQPLLVHAGDTVKLWEQDAMVRIEMSGVVEQSARTGERVVVRVTRQSDESGLTVERIGGVVRGVGVVERER